MKTDLRTRAGRRVEILDQIREHHGFSIFWITESQLRARVGQEMQDSGEIATDNSKGFPWYDVRICTPTPTPKD
jgi:hypothetical protein